MVQMSARERTARRKGAPPTFDEGNVVYVNEATKEAPGIGHNAEAMEIDASLSLTPEQWSERMAMVFAGALARKDELIPSFRRFETGFPLQRGIAGEPPIGIDKWSDEIQGRAGDLKDKLAALKKQADALHSLEKGPVLAAGKSIERIQEPVHRRHRERHSDGERPSHAIRPSQGSGGPACRPRGS